METFNYTTTSQTILADLYTPVGVYMRLRDLYPQSALMESSDYHDANNSRSFIGINPIASVAIGHGIATISFPDGSNERLRVGEQSSGMRLRVGEQSSGMRLRVGEQSGRSTSGCLLPEGRKDGDASMKHETDALYGAADAIHALIDRIKVSGKDADVCGLFGYTSFNAVRYFENIAVKDETQAKNDAPDVLYILYKVVIVFDHHNNLLKVVELAGPIPSGCSNERHAPQGGANVGSVIPDILKAMNKSSVKAYDFHPVGDTTSTLTDDEHRANIRRGIQHCLRGDVFQIVLSRRFIQKFEGDDFKLYRALRSINPSPYLFYFDFGGFRIFGSSPETHCRIEAITPSEGDSARFRAYIDPIAGTTRRTGDPEADRKGAEYLRNDPKENAEHVMLVDLARNDLSRNCHHVKVDFYKDLQYYSHVIHLVSRVSGELDEDADPIKAFIDTFPAGTLSGAPKVRAMQLISEYEPHNRGAYGGCIGIIGLDGSLNQAITIRTFVSRNGELWFQAGGGIVAKSDVEYELQEVNNKLGALRKAIFMAEQM
ncbi:MAG: chorismate-binding protein [Prevotella sp.]|nr:chorismate-binding protein [Prevotella sp.]